MAVESVVTGRNSDLIAAVAELWFKPDDLVVDVTWGKGAFWRKYQPDNFVAHDLDPDKGDGVDFRSLPEAEGSVDVVVFDPPYVSQGGRTTSTIPGMQGAYGMFNAPGSPEGVDQLIEEGLHEIARVLKLSTGRCLVKTSDYISSGKYHPGHLRMLNNALFGGYFTILDEFVHHSGTGPQPKTNLDGSPRRQVHSRRSHSFLTVLGRTKVEVV